MRCIYTAPRLSEAHSNICKAIACHVALPYPAQAVSTHDAAAVAALDLVAVKADLTASFGPRLGAAPLWPSAVTFLATH
jgi:hypothetical protein